MELRARVHAAILTALLAGACSGSDDGGGGGPPPEQEAPVIASIEPNSGPTSAGTAVAITGSFFQDGATVLFADLPASAVTVESATRIVAVAPAHAPATVSVTVRNPDDQEDVVAYGYVFSGPVVTRPAPMTGDAAGAATISVLGRYFQPGAAVRFGPNASPEVTFVDSTRLDAVVPAHADPTVRVDLTVTNPDDHADTAEFAFQYGDGAALVTVTWGMAWSGRTDTVRAGDSVRWWSADPYTHTATRTASPFSFDTGDVPSGEFSGWILFDEVGSFDYACGHHPTMTGTIEVR